MNRHQLLLTLLLLLSFASFSQKKDFSILLKTGARNIPENVSKSFCDQFNATATRYKSKAYVLLQFHQVPSSAVRATLQQQGIQLHDYVPNYSYTATITGNLNESVLNKAGVRAVVVLAPQDKMHAALPKAPLPHWAVKVPGTIDVWIQVTKAFTVQEVTAALKEKNIDVIAGPLQQYGVLTVRIAANRLTELAAYSFIAYVQPAPPADEPLNNSSRNGSRGNLLNASIVNGGCGLNGEGITIGIGDNSDIQQHLDFTGRLINRAATTHTSHGTHVSGTAAGAGIISEGARGYAPKATIISQVFNGILFHAPTYVQDYGMVITNNSYGNIVGCEFNGQYDLYAQIMDQQAFELPYLQHVFATGNSGVDECTPFPKGFGTVLGGYQSAKNVLCVGNTTAGGELAAGSSKGPVSDGRLKPEITAMGSSVISALPTNRYGSSSGTSMAAPAVSGGLALLYQRYRQLHEGKNPQSALMKALVCNGATDKGNAGPDYSYGFGWMNLQRSLDMLEKARYFKGSVSDGGLQTHTITVPQNAAALKVMLYWHDPAASLISSRALVHNLDLEVASGTLATQLPQVLNATPSAILFPSQNGEDKLNNMEQVTINQPAAGTYNIQVKGSVVGQSAAQEYFVVYDVIEEGVNLTYPMGGEALVPGEKITVQWDAYGNVSNPFQLHYSTDEGATWIEIGINIPSTSRQAVWTVPNIATDKVQLRLQNGTTEKISAPVTVIGMPVFNFSAVQCEGYINLVWNAVAGATDYEVLLLKGSELVPVATTTALTYAINSLSKDSTYWVTVRARLNGKEGRRADAKSRQPNNGNCSGNISDNDLQLNALVSPVSGRAHTSTELSADVAVTVEVKNLDNVSATGFKLQYSINNSPWHTENVSATIAAGAVYRHTFAAKADFSATGTYQVVAVVKNNLPDVAAANDTLKREIRHLPNEPINVSNSFYDDLEASGEATHQSKTLGAALHRYDFENNTVYGRLRTFVNSGMAQSGSKAFTLDMDRTLASGNTNYLTGTYNLGNYNTADNDLRLEFFYNHHGQTAHANNKVWIRGDDTQPWIVAYELGNSNESRGSYQKAGNIEVSNLLVANGQNLSSSFQVRWGQFGQAQATDRFTASGYTIDNIKLFEAVNDVQLHRFVAPLQSGCGLSAATPVTIRVYNSAQTAFTQVPVKYRVGNGSWVEELIPTLGARDTVEYTFTQKANLSALGAYQIQASVNLAGDNYRDNDTASVLVRNSPLVTAYPYLQPFESNDGYWYTGGTKSSWQWGAPMGTKINGAASGTRAWKTSLVGNYNDNELSYLYSPCFDVSALQYPTLSFSTAIDFEDCGTTLCDAAWVEYSVDGVEWKKLPATRSTNWYNKGADSLWSEQNYTRWHVATTALPKSSALRLRFVVKTDPAVNREGLAIDDVHIYDLEQEIYDGNSMTAPVILNVNGNAFVHFGMDGKRIASIWPNNQNLGSTGVQAYIFTDSVRSQKGQYYHNRNLTIQPGTKALQDSVTVRFYFLDAETDSLLLAGNCAGCSKTASAYGLGITAYSDVDPSFENGTLRDNNQGIWQFIPPQQVAIVPYDKGYYAEFKVKDFSEFWLNAGGLSGSGVLPLKLLHFSAQKTGADDVLLQWQTAAEDKLQMFEVELARSSGEVQQNSFEKIGTVAPKGGPAQQQYTFTDKEAFKTGTRYYRLKIKNDDGSFTYSPVRTVTFGNLALWQVFPNPSTGVFNLVYQAAVGSPVQVQVTDVAGRITTHYTVTANGNVQKEEINLTSKPAGVYLLKITHGTGKEVYKLYKP